MNKRMSKLQTACFNALNSYEYKQSFVYKASIDYIKKRAGFTNEQQALQYAVRVGGKLK